MMSLDPDEEMGLPLGVDDSERRIAAAASTGGVERLLR